MTVPQDLLRLRLAETIAWSSMQPPKLSPEERAEIKLRQEFSEKAGQLIQRHDQLGPVGWFQRAKMREKAQLLTEARLLYRKAHAGSSEPLKSKIRSVALRPDGELMSYRRDVQRVALVESLCEKRASLLREAGKSADSGIFDLAGGRILLYSPDENVSDGASEAVSLGFYNLEDAPPWDLWVSYLNGELVSWVSPELLSFADVGIGVNPVDCIQWADDEVVRRLFGVSIPSNPAGAA